MLAVVKGAAACSGFFTPFVELEEAVLLLFTIAATPTFSRGGAVTTLGGAFSTVGGALTTGALSTVASITGALITVGVSKTTGGVACGGAVTVCWLSELFDPLPTTWGPACEFFDTSGGA